MKIMQKFPIAPFKKWLKLNDSMSETFIKSGENAHYIQNTYVIFKMQIGKEAPYLDLPTLRLCLVSFFHNVAYIIELECTYTTSIRVKIHNHKRDLKHNICIYWFPYWEWF